MPAQHVVMIDPNVRVAGNQTFSGFEDVLGDGLPDPGDRVIVREPESGVTGSAVVTRLAFDDRLIYLNVDWAGLAPTTSLTPHELMARLGIGVDSRTFSAAGATRVLSWSDQLIA